MNAARPCGTSPEPNQDSHGQQLLMDVHNAGREQDRHSPPAAMSPMLVRQVLAQGFHPNGTAAATLADMWGGPLGADRGAELRAGHLSPAGNAKSASLHGSGGTSASWIEQPWKDSLGLAVTGSTEGPSSAGSGTCGRLLNLTYETDLAAPTADQDAFSGRGNCRSSMKGEGTGACYVNNFKVSNPLNILDLDWENGLSKLDLNIISGIPYDQWDDVKKFFGLAMEVAYESAELIKWSRCMVDKGKAECIRDVVKGEKNRTYVELRERTDADSPSYAAWQGWVVDLWCVTSWTIPVFGFGLAAVSGDTYPKNCTRAVGKHGYILVDTRDRRTFRGQLDLFIDGDDFAKAAAVVDLAVTLVYELSHTCNQWNDKKACSKADLLETAYQYALATKYPLLGKGTSCVRSTNGARMFRTDLDQCQVRVSSKMFGHDGGFGVRPWESSGCADT